MASLVLTITENSTNINTNTSSVTVKLVINGSGSWNNYTGANAANGTVTIDGTAYNFVTPFDLRYKSSETLWTKTLDIAHAADGTKTLSCSARYNTVVTSLGTLTTSASKTLTRINRGSASLRVVLSQDSQNIVNNSSVVTAKVYMDTTAYVSTNIQSASGSVVIDGSSYSFSYSGTIKASSTYLIATKTVTVTHGANGSKTVSSSASFPTGTYLGSLSASASKTLTQIPRPTTPSLNKTSYSFGEQIVISLPRNVSSVTHTVEIGVNWDPVRKIGGIVCQVMATGVGTSYTWTIPKEWAEYYVSTNCNLAIRITSYSGSTNLGSRSINTTVNATSDMKPIVAITHSDYNSAIYEQFGGYVIGKSKLVMTVTTTLYRNTVIDTGTAKIGAQTSSFTSSPYSLTAINNVSDTSTALVATVKDARGLTDTQTVNVSAFSYTNPSLQSLKASRCDEDGTPNDTGAYAKITYSAVVNPVNNRNTKELVLKYRKQSESSWTTQTVAMSDYSETGEIIIPADTDSTYRIEMSVVDYFTSSSMQISLSSAFVLMDYHRDGHGVAIGKVSEQDNLFDIALPLRSNDDIFTEKMGVVTSKLTPEGSFAVIGEDIPQDANLNDYLVPGEYVCRYNTHVATLTNAPTTNAFRMSVTSINASVQADGVYYVVQSITDYKSNEYIRDAYYYNEVWTWSPWYTKANLHRSTPTITRNTSYVTSDSGWTAHIQSNILYLNIWFKISGAVPANATLFTVSGVSTTRGYFTVFTPNGMRQVKTDNGTNTIKTNDAWSATTYYHYISAVIPLQ